LIPDKKTGIVILTNLGGTSLAEALMLKYYELFLATAASDISAAMYEAYLENQKAARAPFCQTAISKRASTATRTICRQV
jgi:hypothetical protein